jgi:hypothetical protein
MKRLSAEGDGSFISLEMSRYRLYIYKETMEAHMLVAHASETNVDRNGFPLISVKTADRGRVSGPGLRAFHAIADKWGLGEAERRTLLGEPARSTYHQWKSKAEARESITLPLDTLLRISAVLGVHKALTILFPRESEAMTWLKGLHRGILFSGQSPLSVMLDGTQDGILTIRRYLDGWRGGLRGTPDQADKVPPVRPEDIVWA